MQVIPKSEAVYEKPLNLTVLEGLDAVFSCKTQKPLTHLISWFRDQCCKSFLAITDDNGFFLKWAFPASYSFIFVFSNKHYNS